MSEATINRDASAIVADMLTLTTRMLEQRHNPDFLIDSVQERQELMDEYECYSVQFPDEAAEASARPEIREAVKEMLAMDEIIKEALESHRNSAKQDVATSNSQNRVLGYTKNAISSSGSYMDFKK